MTRMIRFLLAGLLAIIMSNAHSAWLYACEDRGATIETPSTVVTRPDGTRMRIGIAAKPPRDCTQRRVNVSAALVEALHAIPSADATQAAPQLTVTGDAGAGGFRIDSVEVATSRSSAAPAALPLDANLLPTMRVRTYGVEERVDAHIDDGKLVLQCRAGNKPAGVLLAQDGQLNTARLDLVLSGSGSGRFALQVADAAHAARESAVQLGELVAASQAQTWRHTLSPSRFDAGSWQFFSIACPAEAASLQLESMSLSARSGAVPPRASWVWNPNTWMQEPDSVFAYADRYQLKALFISVPIANAAVAQPEALAAFISAAAARGIKVWAVAGDPHMVLPEEHAASVTRMRAYVAYNAGPVEQRLAGVQFDVEPYLLPGYALAEPQWQARYVELVAALHEASEGLPLEMVVPFWWANRTALLDGIAPHVSGLTVMDYRTHRDEIVRFAAPFLDWGTRQGKAIRIALEAGPVGEETVRQYVRAERGELWQSEIGGTTILLLLKAPQANPDGPAYRIAGSRVQDGSATSFHRNPATLVDIAPDLEKDFSAWSSFNGLALHELK